MVTIDVGTLAIIVITVTASCCMGYFLARIIWFAYEGRNKSPDYIYCGKCHNLVGKSSNIAPHQVDYPSPHSGQRKRGLQLLAGSQIVEHPTGDQQYTSVASHKFQGPPQDHHLHHGSHRQLPYPPQGDRGAEGEESTGGASHPPYHNESAIFHRLGINLEDKPFGILAKELESPAFSPSQTMAPPNSLINNSGIEVLSPRQQSVNQQHSSIQQHHSPFLPTGHNSPLALGHPSELGQRHLLSSGLQQPMVSDKNSEMNLYQTIHRNSGRQQINESRQSKQVSHPYQHKDELDHLDHGKDSVFHESNNNTLGNISDLLYEEDKNNQVRVLGSPGPSQEGTAPISKTPGNASGKRPLRKTTSTKSRRSLNLKEVFTRKPSRLSSKKSSLGVYDIEGEAAQPLLNGDSDELLEEDHGPDLNGEEHPKEELIESTSVRRYRNPGSPGNTANGLACLQNFVLSRDIPVNSRVSNERSAVASNITNEKLSKKIRKSASVRSNRSHLLVVKPGYGDSEATSQSEDERGRNYVVRGPLNYNQFQDSPLAANEGLQKKQVKLSEKSNYYSIPSNSQTRGREVPIDMCSVTTHSQARAREVPSDKISILPVSENHKDLRDPTHQYQSVRNSIEYELKSSHVVEDGSRGNQTVGDGFRSNQVVETGQRSFQSIIPGNNNSRRMEHGLKYSNSDSRITHNQTPGPLLKSSQTTDQNRSNQETSSISRKQQIQYVSQQLSQNGSRQQLIQESQQLLQNGSQQQIPQDSRQLLQNGSNQQLLQDSHQMLHQQFHSNHQQQDSRQTLLHDSRQQQQHDGRQQQQHDGRQQHDTRHQHEGHNDNSSKRSNVTGQDFTEISVHVPPLSPESSHHPQSTDISRVQSTSMRVGSITPPPLFTSQQADFNNQQNRSQGNSHLYGHTPENRFLDASADRSGPSIQCTPATPLARFPSPKEFSRQQLSASLEQAILMENSRRSPVDELLSTDYQNPLQPQRHASATTESSRHNSVNSIPDNHGRNASGLVNPGAISSPQVISDTSAKSLPTYPLSENALKHQVHITAEYYSGFKAVPKNTEVSRNAEATNSPREYNIQREDNFPRVSNEGMVQRVLEQDNVNGDAHLQKSPMSVDKCVKKWPGADIGYPKVLDVPTVPAPAPPPDIIRNPRYERNERQNLHKVPYPFSTPREGKFVSELHNRDFGPWSDPRPGPLRSSSPLFPEDFIHEQQITKETKVNQTLGVDHLRRAKTPNQPIPIPHHESHPSVRDDPERKDMLPNNESSNVLLMSRFKATHQVVDRNSCESESTIEAVSNSDGKYTTDCDVFSKSSKTTGVGSLTSGDSHSGQQRPRRGTESSRPSSMDWDHNFDDLAGGVSEDFNLYSDEDLLTANRNNAATRSDSVDLKDGKITPNVEPPERHPHHSYEVSSTKELNQEIQSLPGLPPTILNQHQKVYQRQHHSFRIDSVSLSSADNIIQADASVKDKATIMPTTEKMEDYKQSEVVQAALNKEDDLIVLMESKDITDADPQDLSFVNILEDSTSRPDQIGCEEIQDQVLNSQAMNTESNGARFQDTSIQAPSLNVTEI